MGRWPAVQFVDPFQDEDEQAFEIKNDDSHDENDHDDDHERNDDHKHEFEGDLELKSSGHEEKNESFKEDNDATFL